MAVPDQVDEKVERPRFDGARLAVQDDLPALDMYCTLTKPEYFFCHLNPEFLVADTGLLATGAFLPGPRGAHHKFVKIQEF